MRLSYLQPTSLLSRWLPYVSLLLMTLILVRVLRTRREYKSTDYGPITQFWLEKNEIETWPWGDVHGT